MDLSSIVLLSILINNHDNNQKIEYFGEVIDFKQNGKGEEICDEYEE